MEKKTWLLLVTTILEVIKKHLLKLGLELVKNMRSTGVDEDVD